jgi:hypothetical protein
MAEVAIIKAVRWEECEQWSSTNRESWLPAKYTHKAPLSIHFATHTLEKNKRKQVFKIYPSWNNRTTLPEDYHFIHWWRPQVKGGNCSDHHRRYPNSFPWFLLPTSQFSNCTSRLYFGIWLSLEIQIRHLLLLLIANSIVYLETWDFRWEDKTPEREGPAEIDGKKNVKLCPKYIIILHRQCI